MTVQDLQHILERIYQEKEEAVNVGDLEKVKQLQASAEKINRHIIYAKFLGFAKKGG